MQILLQTGMGGKTQLIDADPGELLSSLFQKISDIRGIERQYLQIVYAGKTFRPGDERTDHKTIGDLGMKHLSQVALVARLPGGQQVA